jgi:hypothetical protein
VEFAEIALVEDALPLHCERTLDLLTGLRMIPPEVVSDVAAVNGTPEHPFPKVDDCSFIGSDLCELAIHSLDLHCFLTTESLDGPWFDYGGHGSDQTSTLVAEASLLSRIVGLSVDDNGEVLGDEGQPAMANLFLFSACVGYEFLGVVDRDHEDPALELVTTQQSCHAILVAEELPQISRHLVPLLLVPSSNGDGLCGKALVAASSAIDAETVESKVASIFVGHPLVSSGCVPLPKERI